MFNLSEGDLLTIETKMAPGTLRSLLNKLENLALISEDKNSSKFDLALVHIREYAGIELSEIDMGNVYDAFDRLELIILPAIEVANNRVELQSTKKPSFTPPETKALSDKEKEELRIDLEARRIEREALAAQDKQRRDNRENGKVRSPIDLSKIENMRNPLKFLADEIEIQFINPQYSAVSLLEDNLIRELILICNSIDIQYGSHLSAENKLSKLLIQKIFSNEYLVNLGNRFGVKLVNRQGVNRIHKLINEMKILVRAES
jgi:hypothetical protein